VGTPWGISQASLPQGVYPFAPTREIHTLPNYDRIPSIPLLPASQMEQDPLNQC